MTTAYLAVYQRLRATSAILWARSGLPPLSRTPSTTLQLRAAISTESRKASARPGSFRSFDVRTHRGVGAAGDRAITITRRRASRTGCIGAERAKPHDEVHWRHLPVSLRGARACGSGRW